jgi:hypothetical protein
MKATSAGICLLGRFFHQPVPRAFDDYARHLTPLTMPMLVLSGEKGGGNFLIEQGKMVDTDAT